MRSTRYFLRHLAETIHHCDVDELLRHHDSLDEDKRHLYDKSWTHNRTHALILFKYGCNTTLENGNDGRFNPYSADFFILFILTYHFA